MTCSKYAHPPSCDHRQLGARVLILKEPVAHIDSQIDLFTFDDFEFAFVLLHVDSHKFVADLWRVLSCVHQTELVLLELVEFFGLRLLVALPPLLPADLVEALAKEDDEGEYCAVECVVNLLAHSVEVEGERLIYEHIELLLLSQT